MRTIFLRGLAGALFSLALPLWAAEPVSLVLHDSARRRDIPVELYLPDSARCTRAHPCPAAILSHGSGISPRDYSFISSYLTGEGYAVASIGHSQPGDPAMDPAGDMAQQRRVAWTRGAANIAHVRQTLGNTQPRFDWRAVLLVGHSLGGDSSAAYASEAGAGVRAVITLDNRRAPLPRVAGTRVLSLRASDTEADPGVLPTPDEQRQFNSCIVKIAGAKHNDMEDAGSPALKASVLAAIDAFLRAGPAGPCPASP